MTQEELIIRELAEVSGVDITLDGYGTCEAVVEGNIIVMRYRPEDGDWLIFGVVRETSDELPREVLAKALEMSLFGAATKGLHLGLYSQALVLSDRVPAEGLSAEALAERLIFLSQRINALAEKLETGECEFHGVVESLIEV